MPPPESGKPVRVERMFDNLFRRPDEYGVVNVDGLAGKGQQTEES